MNVSQTAFVSISLSLYLYPYTVYICIFSLVVVNKKSSQALSLLFGAELEARTEADGAQRVLKMLLIISCQAGVGVGKGTV